MRFRSLVLLTACTLALTACVTTAKERHLEEGYRLLTGPEITELFSGKTVEAEYANGHGSYIDFRAADGRLSTLEPSGKIYIGTWEVEGDQLCLTYPTAPIPIPKCLEIAEKDGHYVEFRTSGSTYGKLGAEYVSIAAGNVKNLPLE